MDLRDIDEESVFGIVFEEEIGEAAVDGFDFEGVEIWRIGGQDVI